MPEGIERDVPAAEMTDILAYLRQHAPPPKQLAMNQPEVVQPFNDGSIRLFASNCRAYGPTIKMEETYRALGWWNSQEDHCAWTFEVPVGSGGEYRVTLEYSCADNAAGNTVVVEAGGQSFDGHGCQLRRMGTISRLEPGHRQAGRRARRTARSQQRAD